MSSSRNKLLGIEIGGTKLQLSVSDTSGIIEQQLRYTITPGAGASGIRNQIQQSIQEIGPDTVAATGVGFGGPVDWRTGIIQTSHQVDGWSQFHLKGWLEKLTGAPVAVDNDANVAALAEAVKGSGKGLTPVFYITIGSGVGGGLVVNETIYHGATPGEAEVGHIRLHKGGDTLESRSSGWAVNKKVRAAIEQHPECLLAQMAVGSVQPEAALLLPALEKGDETARQIIHSVADDLAFALSHVVHLFHPQVIILGGGLSLLGEYLRRPVGERLPHYTMTAFVPPPVQLASLGENAVPAGALELAKKAYQITKENNTV